jgi:hypothetical protein
LAVADREQRQFLTLQQLLDQELLAERGRASQALVQLGLSSANEDAFSCSEPIDFHDAGGSGNRQSLGGGDPGGGHHLLGEGLGALDSCRRCTRPEDRDAGMAELVCHACDKRGFRPDDDEVDLVLAAEREQPLAVLGPHRVAVADLGDSRVPRRGVQLVAGLALGQHPRKHMLTAARPHHQNLHAQSVSKGSAARTLLSVVEPGAGRQEWKTEWEGLEPLIVDAPAEALPEVDRLIERMLTERGYPTTEDEVAQAADPTIVAEFLEARRITNLVSASEAANPTDIGAAVTGYRNLYEFLLAESKAP